MSGVAIEGRGAHALKRYTRRRGTMGSHRHNEGTQAGRGHRIRGPRRWLFSMVTALMLLSGMGWLVPTDAAAGQAATIVTEGAPLFVDHDDFTVLEWMEAGTRVDVFWGPHNWLYEIRYYGTVGWTWSENIALEGAAGGSGGSGGESVASTSSGGQNAWVDATAGLRVRNDAWSGATKIDVIERGTQIWVTGDAVNGYVPMEYYGGSGWVAVDYLSWDGNLASSSATSSSGGSSGTSGGERWIDINRSTGQVTLYEGNDALHIMWASLSRDQSNGFWATASGTYYVFVKHAPLTYTEFAKSYITHWVGFDPERRNGFHSYTKDANGNILPNGGTFTGGCVALPPGDIAVLYDFASIGMRVEVHW